MEKQAPVEHVDVLIAEAKRLLPPFKTFVMLDETMGKRNVVMPEALYYQVRGLLESLKNMGAN